MTGHVLKKGTRWYAVIDFGVQPGRRCSNTVCRHTVWVTTAGDLPCEKCGELLEAPAERRRRQWHGSWALKGEAKQQLTDLLGNVQRGTYVAPKRQTFADFVEKEWIPALQVRPSTASSYARNLRLHVLPTIGSMQLQAIDPAQLNRLYQSLVTSGHRGHRKGEGLSPRTVRYVHTIVHRVLRDAVKWNRLVRNPADAADPPRAKDANEAAPDMRTWEGAQLGAFLRWVAPDRYGPAFYFAATTGMRRGEVLGLQWSDLDLEGAKVTIKRALIAVNHEAVAGQTKTGRARIIELDAGTVTVLRQQRARQAQDRLLVAAGYRNDDRVFCHPDGLPFHPERFSREFDRKQTTHNRLHPDATLPRMRLHDLRHTWATLALKAGVHPKIVSERLGHTNTNITLNVYSHVVEGMQAESAESVASVIFGSGGG
jgi:integrase